MLPIAATGSRTPSLQPRPASNLLGDPIELAARDVIDTVPHGPWEPAELQGIPSARRPGMLAASWDAARGKPERDDGQRLTQAQIERMTPFLAQTFGLNEDQVCANLREVRLFLGGPAAHTPWNAVTLGQDIYVRSMDELRAIESWENRDWLSHECAHVCQYARIPALGAAAASPAAILDSSRATGSERSRVRAYLGSYVGQLFVGPHLGAGAIAVGVVHWLNENLNPFKDDKSHIGLVQAIHDAHPMEIEAERAADAFTAGTTLGALARRADD